MLTDDAALRFRTRSSEWSCFAHEDHAYEHLPRMLAWRVSKLFRASAWPTPALIPISLDEERKRRAIWCYRSQIPPLERDHALTARLEVHAPKQFWRLAPPPRGWERLNEWYE